MQKGLICMFFVLWEETRVQERNPGKGLILYPEWILFIPNVPGIGSGSTAEDKPAIEDDWKKWLIYVDLFLIMG